MPHATVLIVDDHRDTQLILAARLKKHGYEPLFASDAYQAISLARQHRPQLILLDLGLPGGNGFVVLQRLQALSPLTSTPVIVITADDAPETAARALTAGARAFLPKPVDQDQLLSAIAAVLDA